VPRHTTLKNGEIAQVDGQIFLYCRYIKNGQKPEYVVPTGLSSNFLVEDLKFIREFPPML